MSRRDYCFLLAQPGLGSGLAFCSSNGISLDQARGEVAKVLEAKGANDLKPPYLGMLDYREMDEEIGGYLHLFEKHDPVWLLLVSAPGEAR